MKNTLILLGDSYCVFNPLQNYAFRCAKKILGAIPKVYFLDIKDSQWEKNLIKSLKQTSNCLIFGENYEEILNLIYQSQLTQWTCHKQKKGYILTSRRKKIFLFSSVCDLEITPQIPSKSQILSEPEILPENSLKIPPKTLPNPKISLYSPKQPPFLILYFLGIDSQSGIILLSALAQKCGVFLSALEYQEGLEICFAFGEDLDLFKQEAQGLLTHKVVITSNLAQTIIELLKANHQKITTAESCTGGLMAYFLTQESGASEVFDGGVISYANIIKETWLKVSAENLKLYGAVSEAVVGEMLQGALELSGADFAIATSGIAGPTGGTPTKPVGTIFIGAKARSGTQIIERIVFRGDRKYIQEQACLSAYLLFLKIFLSEKSL
ncbi:MAG: CinA family protein [Helicobacter sp.]|nr:CinA family protein [Helicobacter sp.]